MRARGRVAAAVVAGLALAGIPGAPGDAATTTQRLASDVALTRTSFTIRAGGRTLHERAVIISVTLTSRTRLVAASPRNLVGSRRATVLALAKQEQAIAGINGDAFYLSDPTAVPRGGLTHDGKILKSALVHKKAALYVTADGIAHIGDPGFHGLVKSLDGRRSFKIRSINSLENAKNGGLSLVDRTVLGAALPGCTVARIAPTSVPRQWRVVAFASQVHTYVRAAVGQRAFVTCRDGQAWMRDNLPVGRVVTATTGYSVGSITTLLSGTGVLVRNGKRYDDKGRVVGYGNQRKPETFGCIKRDGRHVLLGAVEGDQAGSAGMTDAQLARWLVKKHCWSAIRFDGSHSSVVVAKRPGRALAVVNHQTNAGGPRRVVNGLFVVTG